ncbi:MAG: helix-turn-helix domain-containing protein, partial [Hyphomonadaceae bacterium]|nr:helix-turn-helix domain-containing protein [Hyphomonadaceae bacterium]
TLAKICEVLECKPSDLLDVEVGAAVAEGGDI